MSLWRHFFAPLCDVNLSPLVTTNAPFTASTVTRASTCHCKSVPFHGEFGFILGGPSTLLSAANHISVGSDVFAQLTYVSNTRDVLHEKQMLISTQCVRAMRPEN